MFIYSYSHYLLLHLSVSYLFVLLFIIYLFTYACVYLYACQFIIDYSLPTHTHTHRLVYVCICLFIYLHIYLCISALCTSYFFLSINLYFHSFTAHSTVFFLEREWPRRWVMVVGLRSCIMNVFPKVHSSLSVETYVASGYWRLKCHSRSEIILRIVRER